MRLWKFIRRAIEEAGVLAWTIGGTALVLITLSGPIFRLGLYISMIALAVHIIELLAALGDDE